jgi:5-methylcytosine-specific restriction protein A
MNLSQLIEAKNYLDNKVFDPAAKSATLDEIVKRKVKHSRTWVNSFVKIGDIINYLERYANSASENDISKALRANHLLSIEDILLEFNSIFAHLKDDATDFDSFREGSPYSAHRILTLARIYDTRAGGIMPIGTVPNYEGIVIKATLEGGKYPNKWDEKQKELTYYLKDRKGIAKESYKENAAIINSNNAHIYAFLRNIPEDSFVFFGVFVFLSLGHDSENRKFFRLKKIDNVEYDESILRQKLESALAESKESTHSDRQARLARALKKPKKVKLYSTGFIRNPDVIIEVLNRANGFCERCKKQAPFKKRNRDWYLEVHHIIQLANDGDDTVDNALGLCPNCHRELHFGCI